MYLLEDDPDMILKGIVSHISKTDRGYLCGINFEFSGNEDFAYVEGLVQKYEKDI